MEFIIDGKRYNTKTAVFLYEYRSLLNTYRLYRTEKGNFFVTLSGFPLLCEPLNRDGAEKWLKHYGKRDKQAWFVLEKYFGYKIEDA